MASFDGDGLVIDRLADIKLDMQTTFKGAFGDGIDLSESGPFGVIIGILSERYSTLWEILEAVYEVSYPSMAFGIYQDELYALNGLVREAASASVATLTFTRSNPISSGDVIIPVGTQVFATGSTVLWETDSVATILNGTSTISVQATANQVGPIGASAGTLTNFTSKPPNVLSVTNPADATLGNNEETDSEFRARRQTQLSRPGTATEAGIVGALNLLPEVRRASLDINDTDVTVGDLPPHSFRANIGVETGFNLGQLSTLEFSGPLVTGNSIAITINAVPIAGSPVAFNTSNANTLSLIAAALQAESLVALAASDGVDTINIQGSTSEDLTIAAVVTGGASQPTATFSQISPAGDTLDVIAQTIWDSKAAGIQTVGEFSGTAVDENGDDQTVNFSQVEAVRIWVRFTLTTDSDYDAGTAEPAIAAALAAYATANLLPGVDVLNYKLLCSASDVGSPGILDIVCENSLDGVSFAAVNRSIAAGEYATIDSADVSFV